MSTVLIIDIVGWIGAGLILLAYGLLTAGKVEARSVAYQGMNVVGALGFIANGWYYGAMPSAVLNIIWAGIGLVALWKIRQRHQSSN
nr:hypothetical protein [uncultured Sphingomonas sp.]